jgi:hypothetical protein
VSSRKCLSDEQLRQLRGFVKQGGGLVVTGQAGFYDAWRRLRVEPGLRGLADYAAGAASAQAYEETVEGGALPGGPHVRKKAGKGFVYSDRFDRCAEGANGAFEPTAS